MREQTAKPGFCQSDGSPGQADVDFQRENNAQMLRPSHMNFKSLNMIEIWTINLMVE
jgi:hypothetical protein